jgi:hypothetical protein
MAGQVVVRGLLLRIQVSSNLEVATESRRPIAIEPTATKRKERKIVEFNQAAKTAESAPSPGSDMLHIPLRIGNGAKFLRS